ncbi:hypothetical protein EDM02_05610 [Candidatus Cardinium hertigii]|uniref:Transposase IS66 central domain-containing protein n=1 Tax=Candidatus Cardinium hertigii TaxID=247481 RepID=A0A3N2QBP8_9BACT|nr:hypothetical protein EDM02_05610 [Candidatus Cardinium hertigii]
MLHIDETSHYTKGKLGWCWLFTNQVGSVLKLTPSRGMHVLKNSAFAGKHATIVSDRYAVYNYFSPSKRQICWSHLARDFERLAHSAHSAIKNLGESLKQVATDLFGLTKWKFLEDPLTIPLTNNRAERQIRHYVVYRKNAYFTQSERGNRFLERIISLYLSWKQQKLNPFHNLSKIIEA